MNDVVLVPSLEVQECEQADRDWLDLRARDQDDRAMGE